MGDVTDHQHDRSRFLNYPTLKSILMPHWWLIQNEESNDGFLCTWMRSVTFLFRLLVSRAGTGLTLSFNVERRLKSDGREEKILNFDYRIATIICRYYFAIFLRFEKIAKLSTHKNFYQHSRYSIAITNCVVVDPFGTLQVGTYIPPLLQHRQSGKMMYFDWVDRKIYLS